MTATPSPHARLFAINCRHSYFSDGICHSLTLRPSAQTSIILKRYRMLVQTLPGSVAVYYRTGGYAPLAAYDETLPLTFILQSRDPYLMNYTAAELPLAGQEQPSIWYFDNQTDRQGLLNPAGAVSKLVRLSLMQRRFSYLLKEAMQIETLQVLDNLQQQVWFATLQPAQLQRLVQLDLAQLFDGRYTLLINGQKQLDFYLSEIPARRLWGVVALYAGGSAKVSNLPQACVIGSDGRVTPRDYTISLESRQTIWRYTVIAQTDPAPDYQRYVVSGSTHVQGVQSNIAFSPVPEILQINGRSAARFVSLQTLPLCERPAQRLNLRLQTGDAGSSSPGVQLPYAQAHLLSVGDSPAVHYSDIYVYL